MADYQSLLTRAVANLPSTGSATTRQAIYDRARNALVTQLRSLRPPLPDSDIEREKRALDAAIAVVESQFSSNPDPQAAEPAPGPRTARSRSDAPTSADPAELASPVPSVPAAGRVSAAPAHVASSRPSAPLRPSVPASVTPASAPHAPLAAQKPTQPRGPPGPGSVNAGPTHAARPFRCAFSAPASRTAILFPRGAWPPRIGGSSERADCPRRAQSRSRGWRLSPPGDACEGKRRICGASQSRQRRPEQSGGTYRLAGCSGGRCRPNGRGGDIRRSAPSAGGHRQRLSAPARIRRAASFRADRDRAKAAVVAVARASGRGRRCPLGRGCGDPHAPEAAGPRHHAASRTPAGGPGSCQDRPARAAFFSGRGAFRCFRPVRKRAAGRPGRAGGGRAD